MSGFPWARFPGGRSLVLASGSPRRVEMLRRVGIPVVVRAPEGAEPPPRDGELPSLYAIRVASGKAFEVFDPADVALCLAADTVVVSERAILGKPASRGEARAMLESLAGREHCVVTGVASVDPGAVVGPAHGWTREVTGDGVAVWTAAEVTRVFFRQLLPEEIEAYLDVGESMDKAGAYGIQGVGQALVERVEGCYANVVGLPLARLIAALSTLRVDTPRSRR